MALILNIEPEQVNSREVLIRQNLLPLESIINQIQSVLVWERPILSAILFLFVNLLFYLATCYQPISLVSVALILCILFDCFHLYLWPKLRKALEERNEDAFISIDSNFLTLPEICFYIAYFSLTCESYAYRIQECRNESPTNFFLMTCSLLLFLSVVGNTFSGILLSYVMVMVLFLYPCYKYNNLGEKCRRFVLFPITTYLEKKLGIHRHRKKRRKGRPSSEKKEFNNVPLPVNYFENQMRDDSDIDEFYPTFDEKKIDNETNIGSFIESFRPSSVPFKNHWDTDELSLISKSTIETNEKLAELPSWESVLYDNSSDSVEHSDDENIVLHDLSMADSQDETDTLNQSPFYSNTSSQESIDKSRLESSTVSEDELFPSIDDVIKEVEDSSSVIPKSASEILSKTQVAIIRVGEASSTVFSSLYYAANAVSSTVARTVVGSETNSNGEPSTPELLETYEILEADELKKD